MTTFSSQTDQQDSGRWGALGTTALTLLVVGAAAVWLVRPEPRVPAVGDAGSGVAIRDVAASPLDVPAYGDGSGRGLAPPRPPATRGVTPTIVIVESQDRVHEVQAAIELINTLRATGNDPPLVAEIAWFASALAEAEFWVTYVVQRQGPVGSESGSIIDLRDQAGGTTLDDRDVAVLSARP